MRCRQYYFTTPIIITVVSMIVLWIISSHHWKTYFIIVMLLSPNKFHISPSRPSYGMYSAIILTKSIALGESGAISSGGQTRHPSVSEKHFTLVQIFQYCNECHLFAVWYTNFQRVCRLFVDSICKKVFSSIFF